MKRRIYSILKLLFFLGIGILFIWIFMRQLSQEQKKEIWDSLVSANYWWALLSILLGIMSHMVRAERWRMLFRTMKYTPTFRNTFAAVMVGYFANLALPRLGEVSRCTVLARYEKIPLQKSFGTVMVERALDLLIFALLFFINLFIQFEHIKDYVYDKIYMPLAEKFVFLQNINLVSYLLLALFLLIIALLYIFRHRFSHLKLYIKMRSLVLGFLEGLKSVITVRKPWLFIFYSVMIWLLYYLMIYVCIFCFAETSTLGMLAALAFLIFGSIGIMIVQGGIGIYPAIIAETAALYGITSTIGYAFGWIAWTSQTLMIIIAGILSLVLLPLMNKRPAAPGEVQAVSQ